MTILNDEIGAPKHQQQKKCLIECEKELITWRLTLKIKNQNHKQKNYETHAQTRDAA